MIYIKDIKEGDCYQEIYLVKNVNKSITSTNKTFLNIVLQDKSGTINAKKWDVDAEDLNIFKSGKFVRVRFEATTFKDKLELKIKDADSVDVVKYDDYIPTAPIDKNILTKKLEDALNSIVDPNIKKIVDDIYKENKERILTYPAASNNHHAFMHGLLYHTVSMLDVALFLAKHYSNIDKDILIAGVFFHDIGKIIELSGFIPIDYTMEGHLLGHIVIAVNLINNAANKYHIEHQEKVVLLEHAVLASHGKYEFGSPILGATKEAILLNFIDDLDAKMMMFDNLTKDINEGEFTNRLMNLDMRRLYKKKK